MRTLVAVLALGAAIPGLAFAQGSNAPLLTESHARSAMLDFGCNNISNLGLGPDGSYHGQCSKGGSTINVMMDKTGKVSQATAIQHVTEARARYALTDFGCSNISGLGSGPNGSWHGQCLKGGATTNVMVDAKGVASAGGTPTHITEAKARSMLTDYGCASLSNLSMGSDGGWYGQCVKGGSTQRVSVNTSGQIASR